MCNPDLDHSVITDPPHGCPGTEWSLTERWCIYPNPLTHNSSANVYDWPVWGLLIEIAFGTFTFQAIVWGFQSLKCHRLSLLMKWDGQMDQFGFSFHCPTFFFQMEHWPVSYGHCIVITRHRTRCRLQPACKLVPVTQGFHQKEKKYRSNKGLLKVLLCLLCDSNSILEILYVFRCVTLFLSSPSFSVQNIAPMQNKGVSNKVFLIP